MLYFVYGSNMHWGQMQRRCPSARFTYKAILRGRRLAFSRKSVARGCGVVDVVRAPGNIRRPKSSAIYRDLILARSRHWRLLEDYLTELEAIEVKL